MKDNINERVFNVYCGYKLCAIMTTDSNDFFELCCSYNVHSEFSKDKLSHTL